MSVVLNQSAYDHAERLIKAGEFESLDSDWNEERPTPDEVGNFINSHYLQEYGLWFLGMNSQYPETAQEYYEFPHGDLKEVQRCALVDSLEHAKKNHYKDIIEAAQRLIDMIDAKK